MRVELIEQARMLRECMAAIMAKVTQSVIEVQRKAELANFQILVATEPAEKYYLSNLFTDYEDSWELLATLSMQNISDNEKKLWLLDHMFLKDKSEKWSMLFMMLGSQKLTYKETTDAIEEFQTKIDLAEANANAKNVTVAFAKTDKKKKYEDDLKW